MLQVLLQPGKNKQIAVRVSGLQEPYTGRAILLGTTGEQLSVFPLPEENNELELSGFTAGLYTLRIEAGSEAIVRQIILP